MKFKLSLVFCLLSLSLTCCKTSRSDEGESSSTKIIGGETWSKLPQVGLFQVKGEIWCTGTLIAADRVLTAAHCLDDVDANQMSFVMTDDKTGEKVSMQVASFKKHDKYNPDISNYDIGYVNLKEKSSYEPLALAKNLSQYNIKVGTELTAVGYGRFLSPDDASREKSGAGIKRFAEIRVTGINNSKIRMEEQGKSVCKGDSGGPILVKNEQNQFVIVGITSCGDPSCKTFGVASRADVFQAFLEMDQSIQEPEVPNPCKGAETFDICENNASKHCINDCYEAIAEIKACTSGEICRIDPISRRARCYDPEKLRKTTLRLLSLEIDSNGYAAGSSIASAVVFIDSDSPNPQVTTASLLTDSDGKISLDLLVGDHNIIVLDLTSGTYSPRLYFSVNKDSAAEQPVLVPIKKVNVIVPGFVKTDRSLYITGQGSLLGSWSKAFKLKQNGNNWTWEGILAKNLEFKLLLAKSDAEELDIKQANGVVWENMPGNHTVGEGNIPYNRVYRMEIKPRF